MSAPNAGPGRPAGPSPETIAKAQLYVAVTRLGFTANEIAERSGVNRSEVYRAIKLVQPLAPVGDAKPDQAAESQPAPKPRKMSEGTLLRRAWGATRGRAFQTLLDADTREFWIEALQEIRNEAPDGIELTFGKAGDLYTSQDEFLTAFRRTPEQLEKLFRHSMLVDLGGSGIAMPFRWELRSKPVATRAPSRRTEDAFLPFPLHLVPESGETHPHVSGETPIFPDIFPDSKDPISPDIFPDSDEFARAAAAAAYAKNKNSLAAAAATESRAGESGETPDESGEIIMQVTPDESGEIMMQVTPPGRSALAELTDELKMLFSGSKPLVKELQAVKRWQDAKGTRDAMRSLIQLKLKGGIDPPPRTLCYFNDAMMEMLAPPAATAEKAATPAPSALSPAEQALRKQLTAVATMRARCSKAPLAPIFQELKAAGRPALEWLALMLRWEKAGFEGETPPTFEEFVTRPEEAPD